ncbi:MULTISPECIES: DUF3649 domain-containing protein [unclassified Bordetella]|uniref:DUF3649 domain-containing protein n=1 Tax=unclassified Bordetella TaxID=2630031 RepID=UPI00132C186C|nr:MULTISPECIES: DUF3649 domain-containing protein [unclassified Bordetella]MVW71815.1 DUF3649 domain-containing protein [Bordetella sp. 15P40C-2]MVW77794.1 DUF3649 domain-containing protein [Bordetella sp. 02P26C-1]
MKPIPGTGLARYRCAVLSRVLAAVFGGYALTASAAAALAVWLPLARVEAVTTSAILAFVIYAIAVMGVFAARNAGRAWAGVLIWTAICAGLYAIARSGVGV